MFRLLHASYGVMFELLVHTLFLCAAGQFELICVSAVAHFQSYVSSFFVYTLFLCTAGSYQKQYKISIMHVHLT